MISRRAGALRREQQEKRRTNAPPSRKPDAPLGSLSNVALSCCISKATTLYNPFEGNVNSVTLLRHRLSTLRGAVHNIEFVIASKDPPKAFDSSKETFDLVSAFIEYPVTLPWINAILLRRNDRIVTQLLGYSAHFVSLIRAIHEKRLSNTAGRGKE